MRSRTLRVFVWLAICGVLLSGLDLVAAESLATNTKQRFVTPYKQYIPMVHSSTPLNTLLGVEIGPGFATRNTRQLGALRVNWVRYNGINWNTIESIRGKRDWSKVAGIENELKLITERASNTMVVIRGAPAWARAIPDKACGPIAPQALDQFADFAAELVRRYSKAPYNIRYWEIGNEIDGNVNLIDGNAPYGCWGDPSEPYFGGGRYAEMLKKVYPAIKAVDPQAQVVFGGLLLDCDPTLNSSCGTGLFFEGVLRAGGANYFDLLAYHSYYYWGISNQDLDLTDSRWAHRGGSLIGKAGFLREVMQKYNVNKPLIMNEGGTLCFRSSPLCGPNGYFTDQATALIKLFARSHLLRLQGTIWYTLNGPGWQESGLLDTQQNPRPAYNAALMVTNLLRDTKYAGPAPYQSAEGYVFTRGSMQFFLYWTNTPATVEIPVPANTVAIYRFDGSKLPLSPSVIVGRAPVVFEVNPSR